MSSERDHDGKPLPLREPIPDIEWHPVKAESNLRKHKVSFEEAGTIFKDTLRVEAPDAWHSDEEQRYLGIGRSARGQILSVYFTFRGDKVRIISARRAERWEREEYEANNDQERN